MSSSPYKRSSRTIEIGDHLWETIQTMARDMSADPATLINQALFAFARANGYLAPGDVAKGEAPGKLPPPPKGPKLSSQKPVKLSGGPNTGLTAQLPPPPQRVGLRELPEERTDPVGPKVVRRPSEGRPSKPGEPIREERTSALPMPQPQAAPPPAPEPLATPTPVPDYLPAEPTGSRLPPAPPPKPPPAERTMQARVDKKLFILIEGQPAREIEIGRFVIGRDSSCQLALRSSRLSRQHAAVLRDLAGAMLEDLGSSNGTWYRAERITKREVTHGDEFTLGDVKVKFEFR